MVPVLFTDTNIIHSHAHTGNGTQPKLLLLKVEGGLGQNEGEWTEKVEIRMRKKLVKYAWLYSDLLEVLKGRHCSALGSQWRGP